VTTVAITGAGVVGSWGADRQAFRDRLAATAAPSVPGLIPDLDFFAIVGTKNKRTKKMERLSRMATIAARRAVDDAGLDVARVAPGRGAVITGSGWGAFESIMTFHRQLELDGASSVDPNVFPPTSHNVAGGHVSIEFGFSGPLIHFASGALSSAQALLYAYDLLQTNRADVVLAGGWDLLCPPLLADLRRTRQAPPEGGWPSRPLAPDSPGPVPAEGSAVLVLERLDDALARGASIAARFDGGAFACGSAGPDGGRPRSAVEQATRDALQRAGWQPDDVDLLALAADGRSDHDELEASGLRRIFIEKAPAAFTPCAAFGWTCGATTALAITAAIDVLAGATTAGYAVPSPSVPGAGHFRPAATGRRAVVTGRTPFDEAAALLISLS